MFHRAESSSNRKMAVFWSFTVPVILLFATEMKPKLKTRTQELSGEGIRGKGKKWSDIKHQVCAPTVRNLNGGIFVSEGNWLFVCII
jgi:hypothetical protein